MGDVLEAVLVDILLVMDMAERMSAANVSEECEIWLLTDHN